MKRQVEMYEVSFQHHILMFAAQDDAAAAASALSRGAYVSAACNPMNPQARVDLAPIEPKLRRVFVAASERACVGAFGSSLKAADRRVFETITASSDLLSKGVRPGSEAWQHLLEGGH